MHIVPLVDIPGTEEQQRTITAKKGALNMLCPIGIDGTSLG